ncbi:MAG: hypothetical protein ACOXZH_03055 [Bacteroidales bacterium]|jgi:hypothetical protein
MKTINKIVIMLALFVTTSNAIAQQQVNVKTLFALLPSDAFRFLPSDKPADLEKYIKVCDLKNGYLQLEFEDESSWEMCYWNLKDGNKLIAITRVGAYSFYLYSNGKIAPTTKHGIEEMQKFIEESIAINCCDNWINCHIPRHGTSVFLNINGLEMQIYQWQNERFVRLNEYPTANTTHRQLAEGFAAALSTADVDRCLQYILPSYVSEQCMGVFEGNKELFICDLIAGEDEKGYIKPTKPTDIKKATYRYTPDDGFANHTIFIELKNGRSYTIYLSLETLEIFEILPGGETGKLLRTTPYIIGGVG